MKRLIDHFRRKPSETEDAPATASEPPKTDAAAIEPVRMPPSPADAIARAAARAVAPSWHAAGAAIPAKPRAPAPFARPAAKEMITLRLGDFLDRIPVELVDPGTHDRFIPMPFDVG